MRFTIVLVAIVMLGTTSVLVWVTTVVVAGATGCLTTVEGIYLEDLRFVDPTNLGAYSVTALAGLMTVLTLGTFTVVLTLVGDKTTLLTVVCGAVILLTFIGLVTATLVTDSVTTLLS